MLKQVLIKEKHCMHDKINNLAQTLKIEGVLQTMLGGSRDSH